MIIETIAIDWRCKGCGNVRRTDVTDVTTSVIRYKPQGWNIVDGRIKCDACSIKVTTTTPDGVTTIHRVQQGQTQTPDGMRAQLSGLHMGGVGGDEHNMGKPPGATATRAPGPYETSERIDQQLYAEGRPTVVHDHEGNAIPLQGTEPPGQQPPRTYGSAGGGADARPGQPVPVTPPQPNENWAVQPDERDPRVFRPGQGGNISFVDTRKSEFLGPEKIYAGVPSTTEKCIGCHLVINDGTSGGLAEGWRLANGSTFERGHHDCLAKIGR